MKPEIRKGLRSIVAAREFTRRRGSKSARVRIEIGTPQHLAAEPGLSDWWACPIRIRGLGKPMLAYSGGVDSLQALELAFQHAGQMLSGTQAFRDGELHWGRTLLAHDLDFALPLSLARLQSAVELTLSMVRKRRKHLSREAQRGFTEMLEDAVRSLSACATLGSAGSERRPQRRLEKPGRPVPPKKMAPPA